MDQEGCSAAGTTASGGISKHKTELRPGLARAPVFSFFLTLLHFLAMSVVQEFKTFALRGNAIDLAVGVVIGAAFNQITTSLANNILTPPIGLLLGGFDFSKLSLSLGGNAVMNYGLFLQALLNFFIIAVVLFMFVKFINRISPKPEPKKPAENLELKTLIEIRDELRAGK